MRQAGDGVPRPKVTKKKPFVLKTPHDVGTTAQPPPNKRTRKVLRRSVAPLRPRAAPEPALPHGTNTTGAHPNRAPRKRGALALDTPHGGTQIINAPKGKMFTNGKRQVRLPRPAAGPGLGPDRVAALVDQHRLLTAALDHTQTPSHRISAARELRVRYDLPTSNPDYLKRVKLERFHEINKEIRKYPRDSPEFKRLKKEAERVNPGFFKPLGFKPLLASGKEYLNVLKGTGNPAASGGVSTKAAPKQSGFGAENLPKVAKALGQGAAAEAVNLATHPAKELKTNARFLQEAALGAPAGIALAIGNPERTLNAIKKHYVDTYTGSFKHIKQSELKSGGLSSTLTDLAPVAGGALKAAGLAGKAISHGAEAGRLGKLNSFLTEQRPYLRVNPGHGKPGEPSPIGRMRQTDETRKTAPNPLRILTQKRRDVKRTKLYERRAAGEALGLDKLRVKSGVEQKHGKPFLEPQAANEVVPRHRGSYYARRGVAQIRGRAFPQLRELQQQARHDFHHALRKLSKDELLLWPYMHELGWGTGKDQSWAGLRGQLKARREYILKNREESGYSPAASTDEIKVIDHLLAGDTLKHAYTPEARQAAKDTGAITQMFERHNPQFAQNPMQAETRRLLPPALQHGINRETVIDKEAVAQAGSKARSAQKDLELLGRKQAKTMGRFEENPAAFRKEIADLNKQREQLNNQAISARRDINKRTKYQRQAQKLAKRAEEAHNSAEADFIAADKLKSDIYGAKGDRQQIFEIIDSAPPHLQDQLAEIESGIEHPDDVAAIVEASRQLAREKMGDAKLARDALSKAYEPMARAERLKPTISATQKAVERRIKKLEKQVKSQGFVPKGEKGIGAELEKLREWQFNHVLKSPLEKELPRALSGQRQLRSLVGQRKAIEQQIGQHKVVARDELRALHKTEQEAQRKYLREAKEHYTRLKSQRHDLEPMQDFLDRVEAAQEAAGLGPAHYFPSDQFSKIASEFHIYAPGGVRAVMPTRGKFKGTLFAHGARELTPDVLANSIMRNIKTGTNWHLVADTVDLITRSDMHDLTLFEAKDMILKSGLTGADVGIWLPRKFRSDMEAFSENDMQKVAGEAEELGSKEARTSMEGSIVDLPHSEEQWNALLSDPEFVDTRVSIVSKAALEEIMAATKPSGLLGRLIDFAKTKSSRLILATLAIPWVQADVFGNAAVHTLMDPAGVLAGDWFRQLPWWHKLSEEDQRQLAPIVNVYKRPTDVYQPRFGSTLNGVPGADLIQAWGKLPYGAHHNPLKKAMRVRPIKRGEDLFLGLEAQAASNVFRRSVFYRQLQRKLDDLDHAAGNVNRLMDERLAPMLKIEDPAERAHAIIHNYEQVEEIGRHIDEILGNWSTFPDWERKTLGRIMFYPYLRYSMRFIFHTLPVKHPVRTSLLLRLGQLQADEVHQILGPNVQPWQLGKLYLNDGHRSLNLGRLNIFGNVATQLTQSSDVLGLVPPVLMMALGQLIGQDYSRWRPFHLSGSAEDVSRLGWEPFTRAKVLLAQYINLTSPGREINKLVLKGTQGSESSFIFPAPTKFKTTAAQETNQERIQFENQRGGFWQRLLQDEFPAIAPAPSRDQALAAKALEQALRRAGKTPPKGLLEQQQGKGQTGSDLLQQHSGQSGDQLLQWMTGG